MLEWEVLEERDAPPPHALPRRPRRRWLGVALLALGAVALLWGLLRWQQALRLDAVRADLSTLIAAEARVQAVGEWQQAESFYDPTAPLAWRNAYLYHIAHPPPHLGTPALVDLTLDETATRALVRVELSVEGEVPTREQRVYRWVDGDWRRSPVREPSDVLEETTTEHFVVRGEPDMLETLADPAWRFAPEALHGELASRWPAEWLEPRPITLLVRWQEFGPAVQKTNSRRLLFVNAPTLNYQSGGALSSAAYYRLQLTDHLILKLLPVQQIERADYVALQRQLHWAEARWWALDDGERAALRNEWRAALGGADAWALATTPLADCEAVPCTDAWRAMNLLLDALVLEHGDAVLGRLAHGLATLGDAPIDTVTIQRWLAEATTTPPDTLRDTLHQFVATPE